MARKFEILIKLMVSSSQDMTAEHLEGQLRHPEIQRKFRDVVERLPLLLETKKRDVEYRAEMVHLVVASVDVL